MDHAQLRIHALQAAVLLLKILQLLELACVQAAVLRLPLVEGGVADLVLSAQVGHLHARFMLLEDADDLMFGELALSHGYLVLNVAPGRPK